MEHSRSQASHPSVEAGDAAKVDSLLASLLNGSITAWPEAMRDPATIELVGERLEFHGIGALLVGQTPDAPDAFKVAVHDSARVQALWEATHAMAVGDALQRLTAAGIRSLVLKGTALAYTVWDRPESRRRSDTDLFIAPEDVERSRAILVAGGWVLRESEIFQETWTRASGGAFDHAIDLHWRLRDMLEEPDAFRFEACHARSISLARFHPDARACDLATTVINCALNHAAHKVYGYRSLGRPNTGEIHLGGIVDTDRLVRSMSDADWERLPALCDSTHTARVTLEALDFASELLAAPVPMHVSSALREQAAAQLDGMVAWQLPTRGTVALFVAKVRAARGWNAKRAAVLRQVWPGADVLGFRSDAGCLPLARARIARLARLATQAVIGGRD